MTAELGMARLETTEVWARLNPVLKEILTLAFRTDGDVTAAVRITHPHFSAQRAEAVAVSMLASADVQAVLLLQSGAVVLSTTPEPGTLEHLFLRPEFRTLEPLKIRLHADDISDAGEILDLQQVLRFYFTVARDDLRAAIGMCRPDWDQPSVAEAAKAVYENEKVRRIFALRRGAE